MRTGNRIELDVRSQLRSKLEPFSLIMDTVKQLRKEDIFVLHATFKPTPLLGVMKLKGYANKVEQVGSDHWIATFVHKSMKHLLEQEGEAEAQPAETGRGEKEPECGAAADGSDGQGVAYTLDNRGLEPPQPMMRTLAQLEKMRPQDTLVILNDRVPVFLIEELKQTGCSYEVTELADGTARIVIRKPQ